MLNVIDRQFRKPTGFFGKIICGVMKIGNKSIYEYVIPEMEIRQNEKILEIGYGHGIGIDKIASFYNCFVTGIDFSKVMFKEAQTRNKRHIDINRVELHYADYLNYDLGTNKYDKIFCINVIYFWNKLGKPFTKIKSELKNGGTFFIYMVNCDSLKKKKHTNDDIFNLYNIGQVNDALNSSGFSEIDYRKRKNGYLIRCKKSVDQQHI